MKSRWLFGVAASTTTVQPTLDSILYDVLLLIMSYLDVGEVICLSEVNRTLWDRLLGNNIFWRSQLPLVVKQGLNLNMLARAHDVLIEHVETWRCKDCFRMELPRAPFISRFFQKTLCDSCHRSGPYELITRKLAKKVYFLSEYDLLSLRTESIKNTWYRNAYVRIYSLAQVRALSENKLERLKVERVKRLEQRNRRSQRAKVGWSMARKRRGLDLTMRLMARGLTLPGSMRCSKVRRYVRGGWKDWSRRLRWTPEEIVEHVEQAHFIHID